MEQLLTTIGAWLTDVIQAGGYPGVILLMAIGSACIPLPSEVIMMFSGYLAFQGRMSLHAAAMAGAGGSLIGSVAAYWFGARGGRRFFERYGRYVLVRRRDLDRAEAWFRRYGDAATFFGRMVPVVRAFISLPAGIARMPFGRFALLSFLGSIPWCYLLAYVGMVMGERWPEIKRYFRGADIVVGVLILLGAAFWIWHHLRPEEEGSGAQAATSAGR